MWGCASASASAKYLANVLCALHNTLSQVYPGSVRVTRDDIAEVGQNMAPLDNPRKKGNLKAMMSCAIIIILCAFCSTS